MKGVASGVQAIGFGQGPLIGKMPTPAKAGSKHATHGMAGFLTRKSTAHRLMCCFLLGVSIQDYWE